MPLSKLQFRPGINKEITSYSNEGGWVDGDLVRLGLVQFKKLSKYRYSEGLQFQDPYGSYISGL